MSASARGRRAAGWYGAWLLAHVGAAGAPAGHLEPFGSWAPGKPIKEWTSLPSPLEFFEHCQLDGGASEPVLMRGAAKGMPAMDWTSDEYLLEKFGGSKISGVEYDLKETRVGGQVPGMRVLRDFLSKYNTTDIYMVSQIPKEMRQDVKFLPFLRCGGYLDFLDVANLWIGRGGSKSVVHYDDQDNINCMFSGRKRFIFMHPKYKREFEAHPNTAKNRFGWVDADLDKNVKGYGAFFGNLDVDRVDLINLPGWSEVEYSYAELEPGDCLYIPYQWYHQVSAQPTRSINIHMWYWRPKVFSKKSCDKTEDAGASVSFGECTWGYEPPKGHLGVKAPKMTKCKRRTARRKAADAEL